MWAFAAHALECMPVYDKIKIYASTWLFSVWRRLRPEHNLSEYAASGDRLEDLERVCVAYPKHVNPRYVKMSASAGRVCPMGGKAFVLCISYPGRFVDYYHLSIVDGGVA